MSLSNTERLERLEDEVTDLRRELGLVVAKQERNLGLLAGGGLVLTAIGGWLALGKLLLS